MRFTSVEPPVQRPLPITSMIDVVFLLLIFFLVTSDFSIVEQRIPAALRTDQRGAASSELQPQIVTIRLSGGVPVFVVGERIAPDQPRLTALLRELPREQGVAVRAGPGVSVSAVAAALQAAADAGFTKRTYVPSSESLR